MLFLKECRKVLCSLTFWIFAGAVAATYISQFSPELEAPMARPAPGQEDYGMMVREDPAILMPAATESLAAEYEANLYVAYPIMFYKEVKLKANDQEKMKEILSQLQEGVNYSRFLRLMDEADQLIGGGSRYGEEFLVENFSTVPMTYEDAVREYEEITDEKNIAQNYTRLYCDYLGILLSIMPVFVCASFWQLDRRSHMEQLIFVRKAPASKIILARYCALTACMAAPVLLTWLHAAAALHGLYPSLDMAWAKAACLMAAWLGPCLLAVTATGALLSEAVSGALAILCQGIWWFVSLQGNRLTGSITRTTLLIRHNNLGKADVFAREWPDFLWNRAAYTLLAFLLVAAACALYESKRKGNDHANVGNLWKHLKEKR